MTQLRASVEFKPTINYFLSLLWCVVNNFHEEITLLITQWQFQCRNKKRERGTNELNIIMVPTQGISKYKNHLECFKNKKAQA